jgi:acetyl esterase/lipase
MRSLLFTVLACTQIYGAAAQSTQGVTGIKDTSYNSRSAFESSRKTYPNITLVNEFHFKDVVEKRNVVYCTVGEKRNLVTDVFSPKNKGKKKRTAVIMIHGGGWRSGDRSQHHPLAQSLAHLGYVCFTPEYRLSTEALYPAAIYDIKSAIRWVRQMAATYNIDTSKIVIAGFSAGGELATFMGTTSGNPQFEGTECNTSSQSNVNAIVDIDGTLSFVHAESGEGDDTKHISAGTYWFGYGRKENNALWTDASPLTHASANTPPTLFINSSIDRMHAGREDYIRLMNQYHIYTEVKTFENSPHSFCLFNPWFQPTVQTIDLYLKKVLK